MPPSKEVAKTNQMELSAGFLAAAKTMIDAGENDKDFSVQLELIVNASAEVDVFDVASDAISFKDYEGRLLRIDSAKLQTSTLEEGMPFFAVMFGVDDKGNTAVFTSGSAKVVAQLINATEHKRLPKVLKVHAVKTNSGTTLRELMNPTAQELAAFEVF